MDDQRLADDRTIIMRGFNDAYESRKLICMSRRSAERPTIKRGEVAAVESDLAKGRLDQPEDAASGGRLAASFVKARHRR
jgi:hypothetical protein